MLFYEDFVKQLEETKLAEILVPEKEVFRLETKKKLGGYGIGIPLLLIAVYETFVAFLTKQYYLIALSFVFFYFGLRQLRNMWSYKITVDGREKSFSFQNVKIPLEHVSSLELREAKLGKKIIPVLDFIDKEQKQIIIPMYMEKQVLLVQILWKLLGERFRIKK